MRIYKAKVTMVVKDLEFNIYKASEKLSQLELKFTMEGISIEMFWFRVMEVGEDWRVSRHNHSSYEFHFIAEGESLVKTDVKSFYAKKGQFYVNKPGEFHEQYNTGASNYTEYCMNCKIELSDSSQADNSALYQCISEIPCEAFSDTSGIFPIFEDVLQTIYHEPLGYYTKIKHCIFLLMIATLQSIDSVYPLTFEAEVKSKKEDYRLLQIEQFIQDNLDVSITTEDIASYMYLSEKQICRIIKKETQLTTKQYINKIKLDAAKQLLSYSQKTVEEISDELGFSSVYYFNQFFKREEGYPPGVFRKNVKSI